MQASTAGRRWFKTGGGEVLKSAAAFVLVLSLAIFIYTAYRSYALRSRNEGDVVGDSQDPNRSNAHREPSPADHPAPIGAATQVAAEQVTERQVAAPGGASSVHSAATAANPGAPPATDTIAPDPPNGLAFGGTGHFQVYRQGDITWRLNTETGATCVLFASDAEWRQPRIRRSACHDAR